MTYLLDTHTFLWFVAGDPRLSRAARSLIKNERNVLYLSAASAWEMATKAQLGRLTLQPDLESFLLTQMRIKGVQELSVRIPHAIAVSQLPVLHRDPFDRILVAQARVESLTIVTDDDRIIRYGVPTVW